MEHADVGVLQRRHGAGFSLESRARLATQSEMRGQDLDGHRAVEPRVVRSVDLAHSSGADNFQDFVGTESSPWFERRGGLWIVTAQCAALHLHIVKRREYPATGHRRNQECSAARSCSVAALT